MNSSASIKTYHCHKGPSVRPMGIIHLVVTAVCRWVALSWSSIVGSTPKDGAFLSGFSLALRCSDDWIAPVMAPLCTHPGVEYIIPIVVGKGVSLPEVVAIIERGV